jgi:hypothetical protein
MGEGDCSTDAVASAILEPGDYRMVVGPAIFNGLPCGSGNNGYVATLTCDVCFTDINDNGVTDVDDLLMVIDGWGACVNPPCHSDLDSNDQTNVDDLLHVINKWGNCP